MADPSPVHEHNRRAWNQRVRQNQCFARPASDADFSSEKGGLAWLGNLRGRRLLCLAAGGGRQGPLYAAAGAETTVVDISEEMLKLDRQVAAERKIELKTVQASMDDLSMFPAASFDAVVQPVSSCYLPNILPIYQEVARVIVAGGIYISQHKQPASLQAEVKPSPKGYELTQPYYRTGPLPAVAGSRHREEGTLEYLHRWEELIGGLCRCGFVIEDLTEPLHAEKEAAPGSFADRSRFVAPYVRIKARRTPGATASATLWIPK